MEESKHGCGSGDPESLVNNVASVDGMEFEGARALEYEKK
jgi:hypothetical protein